MTGKILTLEEVADLLGVDEQWVRVQGREQGIPIKKVGRYIRCSEADFWDWFNNLPVAA